MAVEAIGDRCSLRREFEGCFGKKVAEHLEVLAAYQRYQDTLEGWCLRSGVRLQDVDDVVQETVTVVLDGYSRKRVRSIGGWLFGVLRKQVSNYHRRRRRLDSRFVPLLEPEAELGRACLDEHGRRSISRVDLRAALLTLPARPRMLIVLKAQGYRPREMAQAVGVSPNSVRSLYLRAIKRMRQHLRPDGEYY